MERSEQSVLAGAVREFRKYQRMAERAIAQVRPEDLARSLDGESNSIALVMKHVSGNHRSRWTDFLTTDGEKPDRDRDTEFVLTEQDTPERLEERWAEGWALLFAALAPLGPSDLDRTVTIRGEPHTVLEALLRQLTHYAYHVGQIVLLARHFAGDRWESLSVPRGKSRQIDVAKDGSSYLADPGSR